MQAHFVYYLQVKQHCNAPSLLNIPTIPTPTATTYIKTYPRAAMQNVATEDGPR